MADTDPFGRAKNEDPLAEMGWSTSGTVAPGSGTADVAAPEQADRAAHRAHARLPQAPPSGMPGDRPRRRRNAGCAVAVVAVAFVVAIGAVVVGAIVDAVEEGEEQIERVLPRPVEPGGDRGDAERERRPPRGLERASLLRRGNLAPALARLRRMSGPSRVQLIRLDAESLLVTAVLGGGRTRVARATWDGEASVLSTSPGGGGLTLPWSQVDASAPNRIVRAATRGRSSRAFDYVVLTRTQGLGIVWSGFLRRGDGVFSASADGREVRKVG
jgi:hypothetical protein